MRTKASKGLGPSSHGQPMTINHRSDLEFQDLIQNKIEIEKPITILEMSTAYQKNY